MAIIHCDMNSIKEWAKNIITMTKEDLTNDTVKEYPVVTTDIGFDGTKVPQWLQVDHSHKAIVRGVFPGHFIYVGDKTAEEFQTLLDPKLSIVIAKEVKLCVMSVHQQCVGESPTSSYGALPQVINTK